MAQPKISEASEETWNAIKTEGTFGTNSKMSTFSVVRVLTM